jgi:hypothetical protein
MEFFCAPWCLGGGDTYNSIMFVSYLILVSSPLGGYLVLYTNIKLDTACILSTGTMTMNQYKFISFRHNVASIVLFAMFVFHILLYCNLTLTL